MKFFLKNFIFTLFIFLNPGFVFSYSQEISDMAGSPKVNLKDVFSPVSISFGQANVNTDPILLQKAAKEALKFFKHSRSFFKSEMEKNIAVTTPRDFNNQIVKTKEIEKTLEFIINIIERDKKSKKFRILDSKFLNNRNFKFIRWFGRKNYSGEKNKYIRLTKYAVFKTRGRYEKAKGYAYPLYAVQDASFSNVLRFKFSKQDVFMGALQKSQYKNKVKPLVWLTRSGLEEALMQGSTVVHMPDGKERIFNVDKSNGMNYSKKLGGKRFQKRYWYFKEVKDINSDKQSLKILDQGSVLFAGDLYNVGLGKIIAIKYRNPVNKKEEIRLGVLADAGSALTNNLNQLDYFAGIFDNKRQFKNYIRNIPPYVECYILVKR